MPHCPQCGRQYPSVLFEGGREPLCACGRRVAARAPASPAPRARDPRNEQQVLRDEADRLCRMILSSDFEDVDVAIERGRVRALAETLFPERMELYDMIYESRFDRLWEQFRAPERRGRAGER